VYLFDGGVEVKDWSKWPLEAELTRLEAVVAPVDDRHLATLRMTLLIVNAVAGRAGGKGGKVGNSPFSRLHKTQPRLGPSHLPLLPSRP
jgi:hypothetical protein